MAAHRSSDKQAIGIVKTKYEEMKSVDLDVVSGESWRNWMMKLKCLG